ncbi:30S ribosomal protein S13 [bacterium]|jgi:30S ribosomal protein S13|nr:30S ribosomal protein S13 [bacterium]MBR4465208.1 30S ribosomal protein S13 [bacterium]MBR4820507.1 30S ribosomal protein S13 [bacterium]
MPRIVGVDIPNQKRIEAALQYIYGVGPLTAKLILAEAEVDPDKRAHELVNDEIQRITQALQARLIEGDLRREVQQNIKRLVAINCYRGQRHRKNLPTRGQRTRTNARTCKGPKRMLSAGGGPKK